MDGLQFVIDHSSGVPYYRQIIKQVEMAIADGRLKQGRQLPTVRSLAVDLQINPNTAARAYNELEIRGIVNTQQGTGTFISDKTIELPQEERANILDSLIRTFLSNASSYGFELDEIVEYLKKLNTRNRGE
ncbi:MAG: GntR family transcriptional regulator [Spirochaeta sp. LUC14_002_19_P3]|nr:MAG: GntR family transcriptional regulator [Spirochaeta sp. LUC14_002_19_P3]